MVVDDLDLFSFYVTLLTPTLEDKRTRFGFEDPIAISSVIHALFYCYFLGPLNFVVLP